MTPPSRCMSSCLESPSEHPSSGFLVCASFFGARLVLPRGCGKLDGTWTPSTRSARVGELVVAYARTVLSGAVASLQHGCVRRDATCNSEAVESATATPRCGRATTSGTLG